MSVHNIFPERLFAGKEFLPNPEQVMLLLLGQRYPRLHASMHKKEITANETQPQAVEKSSLIGRDGCCKLPYQRELFGRIGIERRPQSIGCESLQTAILLPVLKLRGLFQDIEQKRL